MVENEGELCNNAYQHPELIKGITSVVDTTQQWLSEPNSHNDPFDENGSITYNGSLRFDFIDSKMRDKFGVYKHKPVVYFEIHMPDEQLFLKAAPANYHSGGVTEALATNFLKDELVKKSIEGVEVVGCLAAYQSGQNKLYLSRLKNIGELYALEYVMDPGSEDYPSE